MMNLLPLKDSELREGMVEAKEKRLKYDSQSILSKYLPQNRLALQRSQTMVYEKTASPKNRRATRSRSLGRNENNFGPSALPVAGNHLSKILAEEVVYFDIDKQPGCTSPFEELAREMGAKCVDYFSKAVTVVVSDANKTTKNRLKAKELGIKCVSILWLADCKQQRARIGYDDYIVKELPQSESLHRKKTSRLQKADRLKSIQEDSANVVIPRELVKCAKFTAEQKKHAQLRHDSGFQPKKLP